METWILVLLVWNIVLTIGLAIHWAVESAQRHDSDHPDIRRELDFNGKALATWQSVLTQTLELCGFGVKHIPTRAERIEVVKKEEANER